MNGRGFIVVNFSRRISPMRICAIPKRTDNKRAGMLAFFLPIGPCELMFVLGVVLTSLFWLWMLVDCVTNVALDPTEKVVWVLVILFLHFLGALIYFFVGRRKLR